jgi:hypothetical protein
MSASACSLTSSRRTQNANSRTERQKLVELIKAASTTPTPSKTKWKYYQQHSMLKGLDGLRLRVAIGAPVVPAAVAADANALEYLVIQKTGDAYGALNANEWINAADRRESSQGIVG